MADKKAEKKSLLEIAVGRMKRRQSLEKKLADADKKQRKKQQKKKRT